MARTLGSSVSVLLWGSLILQSVILQPGCVALNIPSDRLHDPADHGGVLGHWRRQAHLAPAHASGPHLVSPATDPVEAMSPTQRSPGNACVDGNCVGGSCLGNCGSDEFDPLAGAAARHEPEVPWPRYHPLPTRPVFGGR